MVVLICDRVYDNRPSEYKKLLSWLYHNNYLYYRNKIFITTAEFNGLSSVAYILNGRY